MKRRTILATMGITVGTSLVGCVQGNSSSESDPENTETEGNNSTENGSESSTEDRTYEECHLISIEYEWLPRDIKDEVDAALNEGQYETDDLLFAEAVDPDRSYLIIDGTPYDPVVETDGGTQTLELHEDDVVRTPKPRVISISNSDNRDHEVHIELRGDDTLVDETVTVNAGKKRKIEATDEFGTYELTARALTGHEDTDSFKFIISDSTTDGSIEVTDNEIWITQAIAELEACSWDVTKSVASGG